MSNRRFEGMVAVITGVNDRGIGAAIADQLAQEGAQLALLWHEEPTRFLKRLEKRDIDVLSMQCDVTSQSQVDSAKEAVRERFGATDVLINNAGIDHSGEFASTSDEDWLSLIDVNLTGAMRMIRSFLPSLTAERGVVVNIASVLGIAGCAGFPAYSASKAGLIGLTQSIAAEMAPKGIRAVCVAPALVKTPMLKKYLSTFDEDVLAELQRSHPLGIGSPQDVAAAVAFLASPEARWITGVTLPLGWNAAFPLPGQMIGQQPQNSLKFPSLDAAESSTPRRAAG
ncbi:SDR family oxidoreductase [Thalassoglobus sp. JC818]|uniref:SDR family NAD(P)-dependent oxidoreductase n=1 Tax=Thalassoglobus sp. JC818 TaxID=3232136 RepID=UPI003459352B